MLVLLEINLRKQLLYKNLSSRIVICAANNKTLASYIERPALYITVDKNPYALGYRALRPYN